MEQSQKESFRFQIVDRFVRGLSKSCTAAAGLSLSPWYLITSVESSRIEVIKTCRKIKLALSIWQKRGRAFQPCVVQNTFGSSIFMPAEVSRTIPSWPTNFEVAVGRPMEAFARN